MSVRQNLKVSVSMDALRSLLLALLGPGYMIREIQATQGSQFAKNNPIDVLVKEFNEEVGVAHEIK